MTNRRCSPKSLSTPLSPQRGMCLQAALLLAVVGLAGLGSSLRAQNSSSPGTGTPAVDPVVQRNVDDWVLQGRGVADDWTHHHLVFSNPGSGQEAVEKGTFEHWLTVVNNSRYTMQQIKRSGGAKAMEGGDVSATGALAGVPGLGGSKKTALKKDWNVAIGGVAASATGTVTTNNASGSSSVTIDGVTFTASALVAEVGTLTEGGSYPPNNSTLVVGNVTYTFSGATLGATPAANNCKVYTGGSRTTTYTDLYAAMTNSTTAKGTTTWECNANATPNSAVATVLTSNGFGGHVLTLTSNTAGTAGAFTPTVGTTGIVWAVTRVASDGTNTATTFQYWSNGAAVSQTQLAANITTAINLNAQHVTASSSGNVITVTADALGSSGDYALAVANFSGFAWSPASAMSGGAAGATVQPNMYPAKYSFSSTSASCSDFVVYPTGTAGATGAASIVAFNNLYVGGCSAPNPATYWAYNTGGTATTSPVLSMDGTQVAFVQVSGTTASLVLLKWSADSGTLTSPVSPTAATLSTYRGCTKPCMLTLAFSGSYNDTFSAPYSSYDGDIFYVGDDSGNLHKFTGVFDGTPAEATSPWPVNLGGNKLAPPVYDESSGNIIVGDLGGTLHSVTAATGAIHGTTLIGNAIIDAALVDSSSGTLYAFVNSSSVATCWPNYNVVYEFTTGFTALGSPGCVPVSFGASNTGYYLYAGTFDNVYYASTDPPSGNIYVVGDTGTAGGGALFRIPILNNAMTGNSWPIVRNLSNTVHPWPSPVTEFCNHGASACASNGTQTTAGTDYIFFSVNRANEGGCATAAGNGCVLTYNVTTPALTGVISGNGLNVVTPGTNGCWATGGIVVDNGSALAGASQVYFIGLGTNAAGGAAGQTSSNCTAGASTTVGATQASQSSP